MIHSQHTASPLSGTTGTLLLLGFCRRDRLSDTAEVGFGVGKLLDLLDLQAPVFVGNDVPDEDRFAAHLNPNGSIHLVGGLCGRSHKLGRCKIDRSAWDTDVNNDLPRSVYDGMDGWLREGGV